MTGLIMHTTMVQDSHLICIYSICKLNASCMWNSVVVVCLVLQNYMKKIMSVVNDRMLMSCKHAL